MSIISDELQSFLRQYEPLKNVNCGYESPEKEAIAPFYVTLSGWIYINGEPRAYETEVDVREFHSGDDLLRLVKVLLKSFEEASKQISTHH